MLQALRGGTDKGGGEGGVVSFHHGIARHADTAGGPRVRQLAKVGHHIGHCKGRVGIQRDGGNLKLLITETRSVECLHNRGRVEKTGGGCEHCSEGGTERGIMMDREKKTECHLEKKNQDVAPWQTKLSHDHVSKNENLQKRFLYLHRELSLDL